MKWVAKWAAERVAKWVVTSAIAGAALIGLSPAASAQGLVPASPQAPCPPGFYLSGGYCEPTGRPPRDEIDGYGGGRPLASGGCPQGCSRYYLRTALELDRRRSRVIRSLY
jgi:hypothetical protein